MPGTYTAPRRARVRLTNRSELDERRMFTRAPLPIAQCTRRTFHLTSYVFTSLSSSGVPRSTSRIATTVVTALLIEPP